MNYLTKINLVVWFVVLTILNGIDVVTTKILMSQHYTEANPFMDYVIQNFGFSGLAIAKGLMLALMGSVLFSFDRKYTIMIYCVTLLYSGVVLRSLLNIY